MCQRVTCRKCGKATYSGCGRHVEQVLAGVPAAKRCSCATGGGGASSAAAKTERKGWSLFRRG